MDVFKCKGKKCREEQTILTIPENIFKDTGRENQDVSIDTCISPVIKHLWENGIVTLGCCCGHNKANPSIVVNSAYNRFKTNDIENIFKIISEVDGRDWEVYKWELVKYSIPLSEGLQDENNNLKLLLESLVEKCSNEEDYSFADVVDDIQSGLYGLNKPNNLQK